MSTAFPIAVFISGTGSNLEAIIKQQQQYGYQVTLVISNNSEAKGLKFARTNNIAVYTFDWDRSDHHLHHVQDQIHQQGCQLIVLAGFMKILPEPFTRAFEHRIINIHPSLLPKYPGLNTHQRAIDNQDKQHGASVHFVNAQLDAGQVISQVRIDIESNDDATSLANKLLFREHSLLPYTIGLFSQDRLYWQDNQWYCDDLPLNQPLNMHD